MKIHHRLRTKLVAIFFIVTLIPALITGIYAIQVSSKSLRKQALSTQMEQAKTLKNNLLSFLVTTKGDLLFLSQSPLMKEYLSLRSTIRSSSKSEGALTVPPDSDESAKKAPQNVLEQKRQALEQEFLALSRNRRIYYQIRYLDETGQEVVRVDSDGLRSQIIKRDKLQDKSDRYYFKETIRLFGQRTFVSPLDLNRERGQIERPYKPVIRYAVNVYDDNNRKAGIVITNVDAAQFIGPLGDIRLVNQEGYFVNHPALEKRWGGPNDLDTDYNLEKEYPQFAKEIIGQDGTISTPTITLSHLRVPVSGSVSHWTLIIQRNTDDILKSVTVFRAMFTVILIFTVLIALVLALLFSARITRPIEHLTNIADAISKGELVNNRVEVEDKGEIGQLAQAFERMRVSMIKSFERLRRQSRS
jgi:HAMP domain-containing protein